MLYCNLPMIPSGKDPPSCLLQAPLFCNSPVLAKIVRLGVSIPSERFYFEDTGPLSIQGELSEVCIFFCFFFYMCIDRVFYLLSRIFSHMYVVPLVVSRYEYSVLYPKRRSMISSKNSVTLPFARLQPTNANLVMGIYLETPY